MTQRPELPGPERWRAAAGAASALAADLAILDHVVGRFQRKYLRAVLQARTPDAEERAWEGFYWWLVLPATDRKPFEVPPEEAEAVIAGFRVLVRELRESVRRE